MPLHSAISLRIEASRFRLPPPIECDQKTSGEDEQTTSPRQQDLCNPRSDARATKIYPILAPG